jgi:hypothetical protein
MFTVTAATMRLRLDSVIMFPYLVFLLVITLYTLFTKKATIMCKLFKYRMAPMAQPTNINSRNSKKLNTVDIKMKKAAKIIKYKISQKKVKILSFRV